MPQRLSSVIKGGSYQVHLNPECLQQNTKLATLVVEAIARWSAIENALGRLLITILGAHAAPGLAMFTALTSNSAQYSALNAAAGAILDGEELEAFTATYEISRTMNKERNKLAHWIWGHSPQVPNALLLADPNGVLDHVLNRDARIREMRSGKRSAMTGAEFIGLGKLDLDRIYVYRAKDIGHIIRDLKELDSIIANLFFTLDPSVHGPSRDKLFRLLSSRRLYREAIDRIRARQKNNLPTQP